MKTNVLLIIRLCILLLVFLNQSCSKQEQTPNILFIMTDQQSAQMLSCAGNKYLNTPALDKLAARGVRFELAYSPNPSCLPSRTSMMTGLFPSSLDITQIADVSKLVGNIPQHVLNNTMGKLISKSGYKSFLVLFF